MRTAVVILMLGLAWTALAGATQATPIPSELNVALGKPTDGHSINYVTFPTSNGNDGDRTTFTHGYGDSNSYWRVDLGDVYDLGSIRVSDRQWFPERINGATMRVYGADGVTQIGPDTVLDRFVIPGLEAAQTVSYNNGGASWTGARYLQIGGEGIGVPNLNIAEVAAMADVPELSLNPSFITGVSALGSSNLYAGTVFTADELVNNSGMSDAAGPVIGDVSAMHTNVNAHFWHLEANPVSPTVTFDLGGTYDMSMMLVWNHNQGGLNARGFKEVDILTSLDGQSFSLLPDVNGTEAGNYTIPMTPIGGLAPFDLLVDLAGVRASHVRIVGLSNYGDAYWGMSEVRFYGDWVQPQADHPGDANGDGKVDDLDASILAANWQRTGDATWAQADFNADGNVNDLDASILAANWQYGVGTAVPEPGVLALLSGLVLAALARPRWR